MSSVSFVYVYVVRSHLSQKERTKELEYLMQKTSEKLGLREQLDVIKIVNPKAELAPSATEFFIGM